MKHIYMSQFERWTKDPNEARPFRSISGIKNSLGKKVNVGKPGYPCWKCVLPEEYKIVELEIHSYLK